MPNFVYYATFDESIEAIRDLCTQGFRVITEAGPLDRPEAPSFSSVTDELVAILKQAPVYYLAGSFTRFPIHYDRLPSGPAEGKYTINVLIGGPLMQSIVSRIRVVDGVPKILPGDVSYQKLYQNPETQVWEKPSAELLAAFRKAASVIKKHCKPSKKWAGKHIGAEALALLERNEAQI
jgi:hypothetical protein